MYDIIEIRASGGIGRRARLKIWFSQGSEGSIPSPPTNKIRLTLCQSYFIRIEGSKTCYMLQLRWWYGKSMYDNFRRLFARHAQR